MREFRIASSVAARALARRRKMALRYVTAVGVGASLVVMGWALALGRIQVLFLMPALAACLILVNRRHRKTDREQLAKFRVILDGDTVSVAGDGDPLTLNRSEITAIHQTPRGALILRTRQLMRFMFIRPDLEGFEDLRATLAEWSPLTPVQGGWVELVPRINQMVAMALAPLAITVAISREPYIIVPGGIALLTIVAFALVVLHQQGASTRQKAIAWVCSASCLGIVFKIADALKGKLG